MSAPAESSAISSNPVDELLTRPADQRRREYKYRFSQSVVFGLPVIALQYLGPMLGPRDAERWVGVLQALLTGWVIYVNSGMIFEGVILLLGRRGVTLDLVVMVTSLCLYAASVLSVMHIFSPGHHLWFEPLLFHAAVILLGAWNGLRWWLMASAARAPAPAPSQRFSSGR
jgi:cation transport ATPase